MRILVTGGSGRIGLRVLESLRKAGHDPVDFDVVPPEEDFEYIKGTISDKNTMEKVFKGVDSVIHLAAYPTEVTIPSYPEGWDVNCTGTFNVFHAAERAAVKKVVYASSICATGILTWTSPISMLKYFPVDEKHPCAPQNLYGTSKLISEKLAFMYSRRSLTIFIGLRIASVWFDEKDGHPTDSTKNLVKKYVVDPSQVFNLPAYPTLSIDSLKDLTWQYVAVSDVATAFKLAIANGKNTAVYNIGAADTCSDWDSLKLAQYFHPDVRIHNPLQFLIDPKKALWSISKAQRELGYRPSHDWRQFASAI